MEGEAQRGLPTKLLVLIAVGIFLMVPVVAVTIRASKRYMAGAKTSEAHNTLGMMGKAAVFSYETEGKLCRSASRPVPVDTAAIRGKAYQSSPAEWAIDKPTHAGFFCLQQFQLTEPQTFQYMYESNEKALVGRAHGDANGDGRLSTFELRGVDVGGRVSLEPSIYMTDPNE